MAIKEFTLGDQGPFLFDDAGTFKDGSAHGLKSNKTPIAAGDVVRFDDVTGGGLAAPENVTYVVITLTAGLSNERRLQVGTGLSLIDGGAGNDVTISHDSHAAEVSLTDNSAGTANDTVQALTDPTDTPASADALRDDLVANLIPELRNNIADLTAKLNAVLTILRDQNILGT